MFKIGLIILALIGLVGTTTHYAFANGYMGGPAMGPASSDSGSGGSNTGQSDSNNGFQENPNWSVSEWHQHHNTWLRSNGEFLGHHHFRSSCISCHYSPGSEHFGSGIPGFGPDTKA